jgi:ribonucleoside-triphosphate reductase (thioredoxin)
VHSPFYIFDFDAIRPEGAEIKTSGGFAPGPEPLRTTMKAISRVLSNAQGRKLLSVEVFDICCHIAMAVYSGGIRRAATICLFDRDDAKMLYSKTGAWYEQQKQRAMANISVVLPRGKVRSPEFNKLFDIMRASNAGEPGFFWTNDEDMGCNPCGEISLRPFTFCNLTEVNVGACETEQEYMSALSSASFFGTLQASFTDFKMLREAWKRHTEEDRLIGVSLTGICTYQAFPFNLQKGAIWVNEVNKETAERIGILPAKRTTTIKPSGTASLYFGTSSGIHPYYAPFYIRRMRLKKDEVLADVFRSVNPRLIEDDVFSPDNYVISVPVKSPPECITREESSLNMLRRIRYFYNTWIKPGYIAGLNHNNISATVSVRQGEWDEVKRWLWENREAYQGLTILPYDGSCYKQTPFEEVSEEVYTDLSSDLQDIDFHLINESTDHTNPSGEVACGGGTCEVSYL